jgi:hypothetical protein
MKKIKDKLQQRAKFNDEVEERNARAEAIANNREGAQNQQSGEVETVNNTPQGNNLDSLNNDTTNTDEQVTPSQMARQMGFSQKGKTTTAGQERTDRIADTAQTIQQSAQGVVPEAAKIADVSTEAGTKLDTEIDSQVTTMAAPYYSVCYTSCTSCTRGSYYRYCNNCTNSSRDRSL